MKTEFKSGDRVRIVKCSSPIYWYADKIGQECTLTVYHNVFKKWHIEELRDLLIDESDIELVETLSDKATEYDTLSISKSKILFSYENLNYYAHSDAIRDFMKSFFGKELFEPKLPETWEDCMAMYMEKHGLGYGNSQVADRLVDLVTDRFSLVTSPLEKKQQAITKLLICADVLADVWKADWSNNNERKFTFRISHNIQTGARNSNEYITIMDNGIDCINLCYFKSKELAEQAIRILGEETIKTAML